MNLTCPSCDTTFRVDPAQIGPAGRRVRCGSCGHDWVQPRPEEGAPEAEAQAQAQAELPSEPQAEPQAAAQAAAAQGDADVVANSPEPADTAEFEDDRTVDLKPAARVEARERQRAPMVRPPRPGGSRTAVGWLAFLLVVVGLGAGLYFGRGQIVAAVPAAADLYRLAGISFEVPLGEGLELREVKSVRRLIDGQRVVVIEGLVANVSDQPRPVPKLRASVTDATGTQVEEWIFSAMAENLPPGGVTQFETSTRNAPREGSLGIDFVAAR